MKDFCHLHLHTEYSLLDGACRIDKALSYAKSLGQKAIAITDHGVMYGCVEFYKKAKEVGIKPIIGCEVYVSPRKRTDKIHGIDSGNFHLVLLCKNEIGYKNLISLVSHASIEGFYSKPRIDLDILREKSEGLICLSACLAGQVPKTLLNGTYEEAKEIAKKYLDIFGKDNYFIEVQNHGIKEQQIILPGLRKLASELEVRLVATNDCHYMTKDDAKSHHVLTCISTGSTIQESNLEFETDEFYIKSSDEMQKALPDFEDAIENTNVIAEMCNFDFEFGNLKLPYFKAPDNKDNTEYFETSCIEGLKKHYGTNPSKDLYNRLRYEMDIVEKMGYTDYYLIVHDFISYARSKGIPVGPGRGSGAGSLAAYCMGITNIDPIKYNLIFERFLNPERISMPDFDVDICYVRRQEVIDYVIRKYGEDHVAQIITFGTLAARAAIKDVGRVMGLNYQMVDKIAKLVPQKIGMTIDKALEVSSDFKNIYDVNSDAKNLIDTARKLEGMPRHASIHAAGVVISKDPVETYVPLQKGEGNAVVTQYQMFNLDELGLLKMDFLGLRNLTVISDCEKEIRKREPNFSIDKIPYDDKEVFSLYSKGLTEGVFQFESVGMKKVLMDLKPTSVEDLIAVISLYRPGPMESIPKYIQNRHNPALVTYKTPKLKNILDVTYGCIVYQEQVMQICRELGGFSFGKADLVRRAMSKKKATVMAKERENFVNGCLENGISSDIANSIYDEMSSFASYAFNKSHAACYATVSYQTAYLKCHYPAEYMACLLSSVYDKEDKMISYLNECKRIGFKVLQPDVTKSYEYFTTEENGKAIRIGLMAIKNVGKAVCEKIVVRRNQKAFSSFNDFCERMSDSESRKKTFESLIKSGALDCFNLYRKTLIDNFESIFENINNENNKNISGQLNLFSSDFQSNENRYEFKNETEFSNSELLSMEKEYIGVYVTGHPLNDYKDLLHGNYSETISEVLSESEESDGKYVKIAGLVTNRRNFVTKNGNTMIYLTVEDLTSDIEVICFAKNTNKLNEITDWKKPVTITGKLNISEERINLILEEIKSIENIEISKTNNKKGKDNILYLKIESKDSINYKKVYNLLEIFNDGPNLVPVWIKLEKENIWQKNIASVSINNVMLDELKNILGDGSVVYHAN